MIGVLVTPAVRLVRSSGSYLMLGYGSCEPWFVPHAKVQLP